MVTEIMPEDNTGVNSILPGKTMSAMRRVDQNDETLTHLLVCEPPTTVREDGSHFDITYITNDGPALKRICDGIGQNSHLRDVCFDVSQGWSDNVANRNIFNGLRYNSSIRSLGLSRCELSHGVGHEVLEAFKYNLHLVKIAFWRCSVRLEGTRTLSATLSRCTNLREISLSSCLIDDAIVENVVEAIRGHRRLEKLDFMDNMIGNAGCESLATLIEDPDCNLVTLDLQENSIGTDGAIAMAKVLPNNRKVKGIYLDGNENISHAGWNAFSNVLCNPASINETYLSNHTFCMIASFCKAGAISNGSHDDDGVIPSRLLTICELNCISKDINVVARQKILKSHFNGDFNIEPFTEGNMAMNVLPYLLAWLGQSCDFVSHSAVFHLLQQMPTLCNDGAGGTQFTTEFGHGNAKVVDQGKHRPSVFKSKLGALSRSVLVLKKKAKFSRRRCVHALHI